jgi:AAA domain/Bifunctional DNA primase/polymerase, N-terminal
MVPPDSRVAALSENGHPTTQHRANGYPQFSPTLSIPALPPDVDTLTAALAYGAAGWYIAAVKRGTKNPGSLLGDSWQHKTFRDPETIAAWFAGTDHDIALHCGRSGAVAFDVDDPDQLPDAMREHLLGAPCQSTRPDSPGRAHYVFAIPPGRMLGNGTGRLGGAWGEIRGANGVIMAAPSSHPEGGEYRWQRTGPVRVLADEIAAALDDASPAEDAATDAQMTAFLAEHTADARHGLLQGWIKALTNKFTVGESRHMSCVSVLTGAMKEARAGYFSASVAKEVIGALFITAVSHDPVSSKQGSPRTGRVAVAEFDGILSWAVAQALAADLGTVHARVQERMPDRLEWMGTAVAPPPAQPVDGAAADEPLYAGRLLTRSALRDLPKPEPMIEGVLDKGTCALLYGYRGSLKSFIALDWAASGGTGRRWQGRHTEQVRGLYVAAEGAHGYPGRYDAWETGWRMPIDDGQLDLLPRPVNLMVAAEVAELGALIDWGGYGFVVLDTLARCTVGGEENSAKDMGIVVDRLYYLLDRTPGRRGVILGVHHTGKDQKTLRGSSAIEAGVDTVYSTTRDGPVVTLDRTKRKDGPELDRHTLMLDPIEGTGSCVLKASHGENDLITSDREANLRRIVSQHFVSTGATGAALRNLATTDGGMSTASYYRAVNDLLECGYLVNTGTTQRPFYMVGSG